MTVYTFSSGGWTTNQANYYAQYALQIPDRSLNPDTTRGYIKRGDGSDDVAVSNSINVTNGSAEREPPLLTYDPHLNGQVYRYDLSLDFGDLWNDEHYARQLQKMGFSRGTGEDKDKAYVRFLVPNHLKLKYRNLIRLTAAQRTDARLLRARAALRVGERVGGATTMNGVHQQNCCEGGLGSSDYYVSDGASTSAAYCSSDYDCYLPAEVAESAAAARGLMPTATAAPGPGGGTAGVGV